MTAAELTGRTAEHLCSVANAEALGARVHRDVVQPFLRMREEARVAGFEPIIFSGFRDFNHQLSIWNRKARGELAVLNSDAVPLDVSQLSPKELVFAILRWSALPGASRHHWGTDLDVIDGAAIPNGYEVQLVPEEVESGGVFGPLHDWLDERMEASSAFGFFRPYDRDRMGVAPERWHLSHAPVASLYQVEHSPAVLAETLTGASMALKEAVLQHLEEIYDRFVANTAQPPGSS